MKAKIIKVYETDTIFGYKVGDLIEITEINISWYEDEKNVFHKSQLEFIN